MKLNWRHSFRPAGQHEGEKCHSVDDRRQSHRGVEREPRVTPQPRQSLRGWGLGPVASAGVSLVE
jgi:hypothetical protein